MVSPARSFNAPVGSRVPKVFLEGWFEGRDVDLGVSAWSCTCRHRTRTEQGWDGRAEGRGLGLAGGPQPHLPDLTAWSGSPGGLMAATCEISNVFSNYFSTMYSSEEPSQVPAPPTAAPFASDDLLLTLSNPQMSLEGTGGC